MATAKTLSKNKKSVPSKASRVYKGPVFTTGADAKTALLVVSLALNLFMVCIWVALQVTSRYDQALFTFFIHR